MSQDPTAFGSASNYRQWHQYILRCWTPLLDLEQLAIVTFVFDRTVGWGKEWERIPLKHFTDGVYSEKGEMYSPGCGVPRSTLMRRLAILVGGPLDRKGKNHYRINFEWKPMNLRPPKRLQEDGDDEEKVPEWDSSGPRVGPKKSPSGTPNKSKRKICKRKNSHTPQDGGGMERLKKIIDAGMERAVEKREQKLTKQRSKPVPTLNGLRLCWDVAVEKANHLPISHTRTDWVALQAYGKRWKKNNRDTPFAEYLEWLISHWKYLMAVHFKWMKQEPPPLSPVSRFVIAFAKNFEKAWHERREIARKLKMTSREELIDRMISQGYPEEVAKQEADDRLGLTEQRAEIEKSRRKLDKAKWAAKTAEVEERRAAARKRRARPRTQKQKAGPFGEWEE